MLYYRIKPEYDQKKRCDGSILIATELYTPREKERFAISDKAVDMVLESDRKENEFKVEIDKNNEVVVSRK